jgi:hypothetical protein
LINSGQIVSVADIEADPDYDLPALRPITSVRSMMGVPLLRQGKAEGAFFLGRLEPGAFDERQCELIQSFADQAVIAIENARLFEEVQARNGVHRARPGKRIETEALIPAKIHPMADFMRIPGTRMFDFRRQGGRAIRLVPSPAMKKVWAAVTPGEKAMGGHGRHLRCRLCAGSKAEEHSAFGEFQNSSTPPFIVVN